MRGRVTLAQQNRHRYIGTALGYYGLAWSVYSNLISRGREVTFEKNSPIAIHFAAPKSR